MANNSKKRSEKLTEKQKLFCSYYLVNFNATQSYMKAYNCKYTTAMTEGPKLLGKPLIKKEIEKVTRETRHTQMVKSQMVFDYVLKVAFSDIGDYVVFGTNEEYIYNSFGNRIKDPDKENSFLKETRNYIKLIDKDKVDTTIIQEISQGKDGIKIKLYDKKWALDYLIKHFKVFKDAYKLEIEKEKLEIEKEKLAILKQNNGIKDEKDNIIFNDDIPKVGNNE